jgi:hypothetical protein
MRQDHKDIKCFIPFGESIRGFANQQFISTAEINRILRERGIFTLNQGKDYTTPILQTLLLSPKEFDELADAYRYREDSFKTISREIVWENNVNLSSINNLPVDVENFIKKHIPTCKLQGPIRFVNVDNNPNHIKTDFTIQRNDINKAWYEQTNVFTATVEFINDNGRGRVIIKHTAPETKELAEHIVNVKIGQFKDNNIMSKKNKPKQILFSEFENSERFAFFYRLTTKMQDNDVITCKDIKDISIKPDDLCEVLPEGIDWMKKMKRIIISGDSLGQTFFMKETKFHNSLILWSVDALFNYNYKGEKGSFTACLGFSDYAKKGNGSEFEIVISTLSNEKTIDSKNRKKLISELQALLDNQKSLVYNKFKAYLNRKKTDI